MPLINLGSATLDYEIEGQGPVILFAHGAGGNRLSWWQQVPYFMDRYSCVPLAILDLVVPAGLAMSLIASATQMYFWS